MYNKTMLYLFGSGSWENNRKIIKVGFTDDFDKRKLSYYHHNPLGKVISTREGTLLDELRLHLRLVDYKVEFLEEWFYGEGKDGEDIIEIFNEPYNKINNWLWENRHRTLYSPQLPIPGTLKRELLDELTKLYKINEKDIVEKLL